MLLSGSASSKIVHSGKYPIDFIMLSPTLFFISSSELNPIALVNPLSIFSSFRFVFSHILKVSGMLSNLFSTTILYLLVSYIVFAFLFIALYNFNYYLSYIFSICFIIIKRELLT